MSCTLHEFIRQTGEEEITFQDNLNLTQLLLCQLEIVIHVQRIDKLCDWIRVLVCFLFDDADEFADLFLVVVGIAFAEMRGYCRGREIADYPW